MNIRILSETEKFDALNLVREVFFQDGNLGLTRRGAQSFLEYLSLHGENLSYLGAYEKELVGIIGFEETTYHITLFFVRKDLQRTGIGSELFERYVDLALENDIGKITLNALEKTEHFYKALGFHQEGEKETTDEIPTLPMEYLLGQKWLGKTVHVTVEIPYGDYHPLYPDTIAECNVGYCDETTESLAFLKTYIYGVYEPTDTYEGKVIAVIYHREDHDIRLVVGKDVSVDHEDVINAIGFEEQNFDSQIVFA